MEDDGGRCLTAAVAVRCAVTKPNTRWAAARCGGGEARLKAPCNFFARAACRYGSASSRAGDDVGGAWVPDWEGVRLPRYTARQAFARSSSLAREARPQPCLGASWPRLSHHEKPGRCRVEHKRQMPNCAARCKACVAVCEHRVGALRQPARRPLPRRPHPQPIQRPAPPPATLRGLPHHQHHNAASSTLLPTPAPCPNITLGTWPLR